MILNKFAQFLLMLLIYTPVYTKFNKIQEGIFDGKSSQCFTAKMKNLSPVLPRHYDQQLLIQELSKGATRPKSCKPFRYLTLKGGQMFGPFEGFLSSFQSGSTQACHAGPSKTQIV